MSTLDREPRTSSSDIDARIDPGATCANPPRVTATQPRMATIPRGQVMTGAGKHIPVKR